jgi:hypothetical protein
MLNQRSPDKNKNKNLSMYIFHPTPDVLKKHIKSRETGPFRILFFDTYFVNCTKFKALYRNTAFKEFIEVRNSWHYQCYICQCLISVNSLLAGISGKYFRSVLKVEQLIKKEPDK